jgi:integrase
VSKVSQLKALFNVLGKVRLWCHGGGNPAVSEEVSIYLKQVKVEQSKAHVAPKQAKPLFVSKLRLIALYIDRHLGEAGSNAAQVFTLVRDQAIFKLMFFGGDRAHDVGIMLTQEIRALPNQQGFLIRHTWGKTHRLDKPKIFSILRCQDDMVCPVLALEKYLAVAARYGIQLSTGYLIRPVINDTVMDRPLSYEVIYARLKFYLKSLGIDDGETPHSFRGGCAISLHAASGGERDLGALMQHIGWASESSARHYARADSSNQAVANANLLANLETSAIAEGQFLGGQVLAKAFD